MPESKSRKKAVYKPIAELKKDADRAVTPVRLDSPRWLAPLMVTLLITGLLYVVIFYIQASSSDFKIAFMNNWPGDYDNLVNVGIGFTLMGGGFFLSTKWK